MIERDAAQCAQLAEQAVRERRTHLGYLEALLQTELEEREQRLIERRLREARQPRMKTLEEFELESQKKKSPINLLGDPSMPLPLVFALAYIHAHRYLRHPVRR